MNSTNHNPPVPTSQSYAEPSPPQRTRVQYADQICARLEACKTILQTEFSRCDRIQSCYLDHVLNEEDAREIYAAFPVQQQMRQLKSLREHKYVGIQLDQFDAIVSEIIYAFQDPRVVALISEITGINPLLPDSYLYAGGISVMGNGNFLNPHLDNSHDRDQQLYRVLNLLYYVTPDWMPEDGGNLELWDQGMKQPCRTIPYQFNRLVIMLTHSTSWHSVNQIKVDRRRCCVSNYYFSPQSPDASDYAHATSFRGRPEQPLRNLVLQGDALVRNLLPESLKERIRQPGYYQK